MKALFIGRFQPFHKGHLKVIETILKDFDEIIIGIGSSQYSHTIDNPFSGQERKEMIQESLKDVGIKNYKIFMIPDIHNPPKWVGHVLSIVPKFDVLVTNNDFTAELFEKKEIKTINTALFDKKNFSGRKIRKAISEDKNWDEFVPKKVSILIRELDGTKRIKRLFEE